MLSSLVEVCLFQFVHLAPFHIFDFYVLKFRIDHISVTAKVEGLVTLTYNEIDLKPPWTAVSGVV